jgi:NAD-dependent DNA ligase
MDIEGMGESVVTQLVQKKFVKSFADVYSLSKDDLLTLELFKEKKAGNLLAAIEKSKHQCYLGFCSRWVSVMLEKKRRIFWPVILRQ